MPKPFLYAIRFPLSLLTWCAMGVMVGWGSGWIAAAVYKWSGLNERWPWVTPTVFFVVFIGMGVMDGMGNAITREMGRRADRDGLPQDPETPGVYTWGMWRTERAKSGAESASA